MGCLVGDPPNAKTILKKRRKEKNICSNMPGPMFRVVDTILDNYMGR